MANCFARLVQLDHDWHYVCDVCGPWCEGPCDGFTDAELERLRAEQLVLQLEHEQPNSRS